MSGGEAANIRNKACILVGAGGHAKVVRELAELCGANILGVCDPKFQDERDQFWDGLKILGGDEYLSGVDPQKVALLNGVGMLPGNCIRKNVFERLSGMGFYFPELIHPFAWVSSRAEINEGAQIMAGVVVQAGAGVGSNAIINTRSVIDHDSQVGAHCHVAPGVTLCGDVSIGEGSFIGAGATIIQGVTVPGGKVVKAGTLTTWKSGKLDS